MPNCMMVATELHPLMWVSLTLTLFQIHSVLKLRWNWKLWYIDSKRYRPDVTACRQSLSVCLPVNLFVPSFLYLFTYPSIQHNALWLSKSKIQLYVECIVRHNYVCICIRICHPICSSLPSSLPLPSTPPSIYLFSSKQCRRAQYRLTSTVCRQPSICVSVCLFVPSSFPSSICLSSYLVSSEDCQNPQYRSAARVYRQPSVCVFVPTLKSKK